MQAVEIHLLGYLLDYACGKLVDTAFDASHNGKKA
jgi:hypothetical protein